MTEEIRSRCGIVRLERPESANKINSLQKEAGEYEKRFKLAMESFEMYKDDDGSDDVDQDFSTL